MSDGRFRFEAFLSYRHVEPDRQVARWLLEQLETLRVPRTLVREKGLPPRIGRCFRDEDELPASADLNDQIRRNLEDSRFLVVLCSLRTPGSRWVGREIELFREFGRGDRIIAVLLEGEPSTSFHPNLVRRVERVTEPSGNERVVETEVEPLSADLRPRPDRSLRDLRRDAVLRVAAPILGCDFDELKQRYAARSRRVRRTVGTAAAGLVVASLSALLMIFSSARDAEYGAVRSAASQIAARVPGMLDMAPEFATLAALQALYMQEATGAEPTPEIAKAVRAAAELPTATYCRPPEDHILLDGCIAPDGESVALAAPRLRMSDLADLQSKDLSELASIGGVFRVRDLSRVDGEVVDLPGPGSPVTVAFSPDGRWLLGGTLRDLRVWRTDALAAGPRVVDAPCFPLCQPVFTREGAAWVLGSDLALRRVDPARAEAGQPLRLPAGLEPDLLEGARLCLSSDERTLVLAAAIPEMLVWRLDAGEARIQRLVLRDEASVCDLKFDSTGSRLLATLNVPDGVSGVVSWRVHDGLILEPYGAPREGYRRAVGASAILADRGLVAITDAIDGSRVELLRIGEPSSRWLTLSGHQSAPLALRCRGNRLLSIAPTEAILRDLDLVRQRVPALQVPRIEPEVAEGADRMTSLVLRMGIEGIAASENGRWLATAQGSMFGKNEDPATDVVQLFDLSRPARAPRTFSWPLESLLGVSVPIDGFGLEFVRGDSLLLVGGRAGLWCIDLLGGGEPWRIDEHAVVALAVRCEGEGIDVVVAGSDRLLRSVQVHAGGQTIKKVVVGESDWIGVAVARAGRIAVAAERSGRLCVWTLGSDRVAWYPTGLGDLSAVAVSDDGRLLAIGDNEGRVQIRPATTPQTVLLEHRLSRAARGLSFSAGGDRVVAATGEARRRVELIQTAPEPLTASVGEVWSLATRPEDGLPEDLLTRHTPGFVSMAMTRDGTCAVAATASYEVMFLSPSLAVARRAAARGVRRMLTNAEWSELVDTSVNASYRMTSDTIRSMSR